MSDDLRRQIRDLKEDNAELLRQIADLQKGFVKAFNAVEDVKAERVPFVEHRVAGPRARVNERREEWRLLEKESAAATDGEDRPRPNKGDGSSFGGRFSRECKNTEGPSLSVKRAWLAKIRREAREAGRLPMLVVGFGRGPEGETERWACFPLDLLPKSVAAIVGFYKAKGG